MKDLSINIDKNETDKMLADIKAHCQSQGQAAADNIRKSGQFLALRLGAEVAAQSEVGANNARKNAALLAAKLGF